MRQRRCNVCHAPDKKLLGPSWQEIAAKHNGQTSAAAWRRERARKGSVKVWGELPMPATGTDQLSDAALQAVGHWLLKAR